MPNRAAYIGGVPILALDNSDGTFALGTDSNATATNRVCEIGGVQLRCTGDGTTYRLAVTTASASSTDRVCEIGGVQLRCARNSDGTYSLATSTAAAASTDRVAEIGGGRFRVAADGAAYRLVTGDTNSAGSVLSWGGVPFRVTSGGGLLISDTTPPITYLFRDRFTPDDPTPLNNPRAGLVGQWAVTDSATPTVLFTQDGYLSQEKPGGGYGIGNVLGWTAAALVGKDGSGNPFARTQGRAFTILIDPEDRHSTMSVHWQAGASAATPDTAAEIGWVSEDGYLAIVANGQRIYVAKIGNQHGVIRPMLYLLTIVLQASGGYVLLSTWKNDPGSSGNSCDPVGIPAFPSARIVWAEQYGTTTPVYPVLNFNTLYNYPGGNRIKEANVIDIVSNSLWTAQNGLAAVYDTFNRADSTSALGGGWTVDSGTWGISSNQAYQPGTPGFCRAWRAGVADGVVEVDLTVGASKNIGVIVRRVDASNFMRVWLNGGNQIAMQFWIAGAFHSNFLSTGYTFTVGQTYRLRVAFQGGWYQVWINGVVILQWTQDVNNRLNTGTGVGPYSVNDGGASRWDNFVCWPHTVALPSELQQTPIPILTAGSTVASDDFNQSNGTNVTAYTPPLGGPWSAVGGTWTIQGNKLTSSIAAGVDSYITQTLGVGAFELSVDITQPSPLGAYVFAGLAFVTDATNWAMVRLADDVVGQPNDHEIEIVIMVAGQAKIVHKVQFGIAYPAGSTHNLKARIYQGRLYILFDD